MSDSGSGSGSASVEDSKSKLTFEELSELNDRKAEIRADHNAYMRDHPELKTFMSDFMAALLQRKPADVYEFANDYFGAFIKKREEEAAAAEASAEAAREAAEAAAADEGKDEDA